MAQANRAAQAPPRIGVHAMIRTAHRLTVLLNCASGGDGEVMQQKSRLKLRRGIGYCLRRERRVVVHRLLPAPGFH